jgi:DNA-binding response OmpR family regulator
MSDKKRILIIDDERLICSTLSDYLEDEGYETTCASNGDEGLAMLESDHGFNLVITDIMMPKKEGISTIRQTKLKYPQMKIIAISGALYQNNYLETATFFGADQVFAKPVDILELCLAVQKLLDS